jgi:hypothetical protein
MSFVSASTGLLLGLLFDPEDGGDIFLRNSEKLFELHDVTTQKTTLYFRRSIFGDSLQEKLLFLWQISEIHWNV